MNQHVPTVANTLIPTPDVDHTGPGLAPSVPPSSVKAESVVAHTPVAPLDSTDAEMEQAEDDIVKKLERLAATRSSAKSTKKKPAVAKKDPPKATGADTKTVKSTSALKDKAPKKPLLLGCGKCRGHHLGCSQCKVPSFAGRRFQR